MPTLLELQTAMRASLVHRDGQAVAAMLARHIGADRLDIYRNTFIHTLTRALRLSFPITERLVGEEFFEGAAQIFIAQHPPRAAWLDQYGGESPLSAFAPAGEVASSISARWRSWNGREWRAARRGRLAAGRCRSQPSNPKARDWSASLRSLDPIVAAGIPGRRHMARGARSDDDALGNVDLGSGPIKLLVERRATGVEVERLTDEAWRFLSALCAGRSIESALDDIKDFDCTTALAEHLALGRLPNSYCRNTGCRVRKTA